MEKKKIVVEVDKEIHKKMHILCIQKEVSISDFVRNLIEEALNHGAKQNIN